MVVGEASSVPEGWAVDPDAGMSSVCISASIQNAEFIISRLHHCTVSPTGDDVRLQAAGHMFLAGKLAGRAQLDTLAPGRLLHLLDEVSPRRFFRRTQVLPVQFSLASLSALTVDPAAHSHFSSTNTESLSMNC